MPVTLHSAGSSGFGFVPTAGAIDEAVGLGEVGTEIEAMGREGGGVAMVPRWSEERHGVRGWPEKFGAIVCFVRVGLG